GAARQSVFGHNDLPSKNIPWLGPALLARNPAWPFVHRLADGANNRAVPPPIARCVRLESSSRGAKRRGDPVGRRAPGGSSLPPGTRSRGSQWRAGLTQVQFTLSALSPLAPPRRLGHR